MSELIVDNFAGGGGASTGIESGEALWGDRMKVRVWQINHYRDVHSVKFLCYDKAKEYAGKIDPSIYDKAWEGELKANDIERVYVILNTEPPADYSTYALSVSDVVEVVSSKDVASGYYFCDRIGFKRLEDDWREETEQ